MEKLSDELKKYGYVFSWKKSIAMYIAVFAAMVGLGLFFRLKVYACASLIVSGFIFLPFFLRNVYRNRYFQRKFSDVNIYMEQFLYSFQRSGKVLTTLEDMLMIFEAGDMRRAVEKARDHILHTFNEEDVERSALAIIEKEYPYEGVSTIHNFALNAERLGGEYGESVMLLLESRRMFADRIYAMQQEQKNKRREIAMSVATSLLLCSMIFVLSAKLGVDVSGNPVAQIITAVVLILDIVILFVADSRLTYVYLQDNDDTDDEEYAKKYKRIREYNEDGLIGRMGKQAAIKSLSRDIEKQFPSWLMEVSLLLQTENVAVAVQKSYQAAPGSLKPALADFILDLKEYPESMEPYRRFLSEFSLPEISSSMKMLYSISSGTGGDARTQIADIIRRNQIMFDKARKLEDEDKAAGMYALFLAPQLTGGLKLVVDMVLLLVMYMAEQKF